MKRGAIKPSRNTLLHIDYHSDFSAPALRASLYSLNEDLDKIKEFTYRELSIAGFIAPAVYLGLFNKVFWIGVKERESETPTLDRIDVLPINNEKRIMKQKRIEGYIQSMNKDGRNFKIHELLPKIKALPYSGRKEFVYHYASLPASVNLSDSVVLDIDLDYFSCWEHPRKSIELTVEITKEAYGLLQNHYHPVNLLMKRPFLEKSGERYFACFSHPDTDFQSQAKVGRKEIMDRIDAFISFLAENNVFPQIIDICRSRHSGYTPADQWEFIEENLIESLRKLYAIEIVRLQDIIN